jgi:hypothetical protein
MRTHSWLITTALACTLPALPVLLTPAPAAAQGGQIIVQHASRGMLGLLTEPVPTAGLPATQQRVVDVVPGSAAARAGIAVGDTILRFNGLPASDQVLRAPLEAGDTIVLRVRRGGMERDVRVVAEPRVSYHFTAPDMRVLPDTIRERVAFMMDRVQAELDTLRRRQVFVHRDSMVMMWDSARVFRFRADSLRARPFMIDSLLDLRVFGDSRMFHRDSLELDSLVRRFTREAVEWPRVMRDSAWLSAAEARAAMPRAGEMLVSAYTVGLRAIAGAELAELNAGLAAYFNAADGVLVLNAREGTPAALAGIEAGDVIVRVGATPVTSIAELRRAIDAASPGTSVQLRLLRRGQPVDVQLRRD